MLAYLPFTQNTEPLEERLLSRYNIKTIDLPPTKIPGAVTSNEKRPVPEFSRHM
jgi:hypothetical protein